MLYKVAVHGVTIRCSIQLHPVRHDVDGVVTLLQENDVRYNLCTGVCLKCRIGQSNGSQEFRSLCHIFSGIRIF